MVTLAEPKQSDLPRAEPPWVRRAPNSPAQDEYSVDFDRYMMIYSNHTPCRETEYVRRSSIAALMLGHNGVHQPIEIPPASETSIGCYLGDELVGTINFYGPADKYPRSTVDSDGLVILWYPLTYFANILNILHQEKLLSLSLVHSDLEGEVMEPPMGVLLSWPQRIGHEADSNC